MPAKNQNNTPHQEVETLSGSVERIVYHNPENGFYVLKVENRESPQSHHVIGSGGLDIHPGSFLQASGRWIDDPHYGRQFKADVLRVSTPDTRDGIERFLASGAIEGISKVYAKKLVKTFGDDVLNIIETDISQLKKIKGIGTKRLAAIRHSWEEHKAVREIMIFLHAHGIGTARSAHIFRVYGNETVQHILADPYCLARDISGIGFRLADNVARKLGVGEDSPPRIRAALSFLLDEAAGQGHCGLPHIQLCAQSAELLSLDTDLIETAIKESIQRGELVRDTLDDTECLFHRRLYQAECAIARKLISMAHQPAPWPPIDTKRAIAWAQDNTDIALADGQRRALERAMTRKVFILTGGPGVGKTTLINTYLMILKARKIRIALAAPTGRAAKRLSDSTGMEAKTIHRLLEVNAGTSGFRRDAGNPLECDVVVVDEMSMVDIPLFHALLRALSDHAALLMVGDADQLPPVGPGQVFADCVVAKTLESERLVEIFRQAKSSRIVTNAHRVNQGHMPDTSHDDPQSDFYFIPAENPEEALETTLEVVVRRIPRRYGLDPVHDIQVLAPMNRGVLGVQNLNEKLREQLNPERSLRIEKAGRSVGLGDKVMQTENDYDKDVYNGDIGFVSNISPSDSRVRVTFDSREVPYTFREIDQLVPAYATTIHKSQGSEYPAVVIPLVMQHYLMLRRDLLYTAMTRGKRLVIIIGEQRALQRAVTGTSEIKRWSMLRKLMANTDIPPSP